MKEAWFLWNPEASPRAVTLDAVGFRAVEDLLGEPLERAGNQVSLEIPGLDVRCLVLGR